MAKIKTPMTVPQMVSRDKYPRYADGRLRGGEVGEPGQVKVEWDDEAGELVLRITLGSAVHLTGETSRTRNGNEGTVYWLPVTFDAEIAGLPAGPLGDTHGRLLMTLQGPRHFPSETLLREFAAGAERAPKRQVVKL